MNFTSDIKKEIIANNLKIRKSKTTEDLAESCKKSALSAFLRTSGELGFVDGKPTFFIVSETENVAEFFISTCMELFQVELSIANVSLDRLSGRVQQTEPRQELTEISFSRSLQRMLWWR